MSNKSNKKKRGQARFLISVQSSRLALFKFLNALGFLLNSPAKSYSKIKKMYL